MSSTTMASDANVDQEGGETKLEEGTVAVVPTPAPPPPVITIIPSNNTPDCIWHLTRFVLEQQMGGFRTMPPPMPFPPVGQPSIGDSSNCPSSFFLFQHLPQFLLDAKTGLILIATARADDSLTHHIVGLCWFTVPPNTTDFYIQYLYVVPNYQRRGIGSQLLQKLHEACNAFWRHLAVPVQRQVGARVVLRADGAVSDSQLFWAKRGYFPTNMQQLGTAPWVAQLSPPLPSLSQAQVAEQIVTKQIKQAADVAARMAVNRAAVDSVPASSLLTLQIPHVTSRHLPPPPPPLERIEEQQQQRKKPAYSNPKKRGRTTRRKDEDDDWMPHSGGSSGMLDHY